MIARIALAALLLVVGTSVAAAYETRRLTIEHDGIRRTAIVDLQPGSRNAPVLIALHGGLAGPMTIRRKARVTLANEGWLVVWPSALGDWNDGRKDHRGQPYDDADDIGFLRKLVAVLTERGLADPDRIYFAGPSIGGVMVLRLLCDAPDLMAGAAVAIASFPTTAGCAATVPTPIVFLHGTEDDLMPPDGGRIGGWSPLVRDRGYVRPVAETLDILARNNRCDGFDEAALPDLRSDDNSRVTLRRYRGCAAPLLHYIVEGGGHTWPGAAQSGLGKRVVGETNYDISATRVIQDFFRTLAGPAVTD